MNCSVCGKNWGGLRAAIYHRPLVDCPWCGATEEQQVAETLRLDVLYIVERERAGEQVSAETMNFMLYGE
jgi:hypothetical protein